LTPEGIGTWPDVDLPSTSGHAISLRLLRGPSVCFVYPYSGRPGVADPKDWNNIPGAHGSTPQAQTYSKLYTTFLKCGANIFGISGQGTPWQCEFKQRLNLPYDLLSDAHGRLARALCLETFSAGTSNYLRRRTFIVRDGVITHDEQNVDPHGDAAKMLALLKAGAA
jgi:peroxiredoxin